MSDDEMPVMDDDTMPKWMFDHAVEEVESLRAEVARLEHRTVNLLRDRERVTAERDALRPQAAKVTRPSGLPEADDHAGWAAVYLDRMLRDADRIDGGEMLGAMALGHHAVALREYVRAFAVLLAEVARLRSQAAALAVVRSKLPNLTIFTPGVNQSHQAWESWKAIKAALAAGAAVSGEPLGRHTHQAGSTIYSGDEDPSCAICHPAAVSGEPT